METTVLRARDLPPTERLDGLRHALETGVAAAPVDIRIGGQPDVDAELKSGAVGVLDIVAGRHGAGEVRRTVRHIRRSDPEQYKIVQVTEGKSVIEQNGRTALLGPGDFTLLDTSNPVRWVYTAGAVCVAIPRGLLPLRPSQVAAVVGVGIPGNNGIGALAANLIAGLPSLLNRTSPGVAARLSSVVIDVVGAAIAELLDRDLAPPESHQRVLLMQIYEFIEKRLGDPELSPTTVAAAHHISKRYLHKLFRTEHATVADWIRRRRLERCRAVLMDPTTRQLPVSAFGARWGFTNPAHFSRVFRDAYGSPPGEFRRAWCSSGADTQS